MSLSLLVQGPYIICGYNKGFEGRQTTRFRTNSLWCRSEFPLACHGVIRWRAPICLWSLIWFLPYSSRNQICSRFVFSVLEAMFDGWLALNSIRSLEQIFLQNNKKIKTIMERCLRSTERFTYWNSILWIKEDSDYKILKLATLSLYTWKQHL